MTIDPKKDLRLSGEVARYHTWPVNRGQSVGEHSWQVARILMSILPPSELLSRLVQYAILHDVGELVTGDVPFPVKAQNPELKKEFDGLEHRAQAQLLPEWGISTQHLTGLTDREKHLFKLAEFIEMWEFGYGEMKRGNQFAELVAKRCFEQVERYVTAKGGLITREEVQSTLRYIDKRLGVFGL